MGPDREGVGAAGRCHWRRGAACCCCWWKSAGFGWGKGMMLLCDCCCCWCSSEGGILVLPVERRIDPMEMVDNAAASLFSTIPGFLETCGGGMVGLLLGVSGGLLKLVKKCSEPRFVAWQCCAFNHVFSLVTNLVLCSWCEC